MKQYYLNERAFGLIHDLDLRADDLRVSITKSDTGTIIDMGVATTGSVQAGLLLARLAMADLGEVSLHPGLISGCPLVQVQSDNPVMACLASQYAGWQVKTPGYFAMGSGPMRSTYGQEALFEHLGYREKAYRVLGVLEAKTLPTAEVFAEVASKCQVAAHTVTLAVAPTTSIAGSLQVVARSVETALHKLHELKFDLKSIVSAIGTAPLPPIAKKTNTAIGYTNDAILYGGDVTLWVQCDDDVLSTIGPKVPASASSDYGVPFAELFEQVGGDFYKIDPLLFSPARITFHNLSSGRMHTFGKLNLPLLEQSWGLHS
jgi:methenyltetrahydromethanopterin cyclohydrolase